MDDNTNNALNAIGSTVGGAGMGIALNAIGGIQQQNQNQHNMYLQNQQARDMAVFNRQQQMQLWNDTNYSAQVEQLKKAGLNVGLLYKAAGSGGTTQTAPAQNAQSAQAPNNAGLGIEGIMAMNQFQMQQAQIELAKAQADKARADAEKARGADTENTRANTALLQVQKSLQDIQLSINNDTKIDQIIAIQANAGKVRGEMNSAIANGTIANETVRTQIEQTTANLISTYIQQRAIKAGIKLTEAQTKAVGEQVAQGWINANANATNARSNQKNVDINTDINLRGQIASAMYQNGLLDLGNRKLEQDMIFGVAGLVTGQSIHMDNQEMQQQQEQGRNERAYKRTNTIQYDSQGNVKGSTTSVKR